MSKDSDIILKDFIDSAINVEKALSDLYNFYSQIFIDHSNFWKKLSREELMHASMINNLSKLFSKCSKFITIDSSVINRMKNFIKNIYEYIEKFKTSPIGLNQALQKANELEQTSVELHYHEIFQNISTNEINSLLIKLQSADKKHIEEINLYRKKIS